MDDFVSLASRRTKKIFIHNLLLTKKKTVLSFRVFRLEAETYKERQPQSKYFDQPA